MGRGVSDSPGSVPLHRLGTSDLELGHVFEGLRPSTPLWVQRGENMKEVDDRRSAGATDGRTLWWPWYNKAGQQQMSGPSRIRRCGTMEGTSEMAAKETGVFYSEVMRNDQAPSDMNIGKAFDAIVRQGLFEKEGIRLFEAKPVSEELVLRVHSPEWIAQVKREGLWRVSLSSAGAVVMAFDKILSGELHNALALVGIGGHHAGRDYAYGGCYVNHEAIAVAWARKIGKGRRFAIVDTDTHHGDGTRELFWR